MYSASRLAPLYLHCGSKCTSHHHPCPTYLSPGLYCCVGTHAHGQSLPSIPLQHVCGTRITHLPCLPLSQIIDTSHGCVPLSELLNTFRFNLDTAQQSPGWLFEINRFEAECQSAAASAVAAALSSSDHRSHASSTTHSEETAAALTHQHDDNDSRQESASSSSSSDSSSCSSSCNDPSHNHPHHHHHPHASGHVQKEDRQACPGDHPVKRRNTALSVLCIMLSVPSTLDVSWTQLWHNHGPECSGPRWGQGGQVLP